MRNCSFYAVLLPASIKTVEKMFCGKGGYGICYTDLPLDGALPTGWNPNFCDTLGEGARTSAIYGCTFGYKDGIPYLISLSLRSNYQGSPDNWYGYALMSPGFILPERRGYTFCGFALSSNQDPIYKPELFSEYSEYFCISRKKFLEMMEKNPNSTITLYAIWKKNYSSEGALRDRSAGILSLCAYKPTASEYTRRNWKPCIRRLGYEDDIPYLISFAMDRRTARNCPLFRFGKIK